MKKEKEFVLPGDVLVKSLDWLPGKNCYRDGEEIVAKKLGLVQIKNRVISVIPFNSIYLPRAGDMVVGKVVDIQSNGWIVDINTAYDAFLPLAGMKQFIDITKTDLSTILDVGDLIYAKIERVSKTSVYLSMKDPLCKKIQTGRLLTINPAKIPRVIGRGGSMVSIIKKASGSKIFIGQNGFIWIEGGKEELVIKAIKLIDREFYKEGLTDRVAKFLEENA
ncbi:MAG: RNA-binding protein [Candidatus Aenigmatarchaeota archaeon]|nr:MAG: RNA-binding protein [Candidatus Aenigmarchaeota archaeon]